jgi:uncharacterized protein YcbK (DUF882 family)
MIITLNNNTLMTDDIWKRMKYMTPSDNWGDITKISYMLAQTLENMRIYSKRRIFLTCPAYSKDGHSKTSQHYLGKAADVRIEGMSLTDMYMLAERFSISGLGLYYNQGNPFIHVDVRDYNPFDIQSRWIAYGNPKEWTYVELNETNFNLYCK